ncbi:MAG: carbohydrate kinase, partial [Clostridia bacterium]|nr:carbohydrate kinase [Clostridia bacterium]
RTCADSSADGDAAPVHTDAVRVTGEVDICGAGDTSMAAFSACMAAGAKPCEAAEIAALASAVTVKKLATTGTASRAEILAAAN